MARFKQSICMCIILILVSYFGSSEDNMTIPISESEQISNTNQTVEYPTDTASYNLGCELPYFEFPEREPLFLDLHYKLIKPVGSGIRLNTGEVIYLVCPGNGNFLEASSLELTAATCVRDKILLLRGETRDVSTLNCILPPSGDVLISHTVKCSNGKGRQITIGHKINSTYIVPLIRACYDFIDGAVIYTEHTLHGSAIEHAKPSHRRLPFKSGADDLGFNHLAYTPKSQKQTFEYYFGKYQNYITADSYLVKTHLSPEEDFIYMSSKWATYFYFNAVPQWYQKNSNRNLKTLENDIRKLAKESGKDFHIITGAHDVLVLAGKLIYLDNGKLPVPAVIWKVVQSLDTKEAIGFISLNNAFGPTDIPKGCLCRDISSQYGWQNHDYSDFLKGLTYACSIEEMKRIFCNVPDLQTIGILAGPYGIWNEIKDQTSLPDNNLTLWSRL